MQLRTANTAFAAVAVCALGLGFLLPSASLCQAALAREMQALPPSAASGGGSEGSMRSVPEDFTKMKLAPGFLLDVKVYGEPDLAASVRVDANGNITLPLIGEVNVLNLTLTEATKSIQDRYKEQKVLNYPQVTVNVLEYAGGFITVSGEVNRQGRTELLAPHSLLDILAAAGGETPLAASTIEIKRPATPGSEPTTELIHYRRDGSPDSIKDVTVNPGDSVIVHRAGIVYVLGAVTRPGGYVMQEDGELNSDEAIALAEGMVLEASVHSARVIRRMPNGAIVEIPLQFRKGMKGETHAVPLQPRDIVYVDQSIAKNVLSTAKGVAGAATSALIYVYK